jgi:superfamily II DNA or RNA helicase
MDFGDPARHPPSVIRLSYVHGTVEVRDIDDPSVLPPDCVWDERTRCHRAPAVAYASIVLALHRRKIPYEDTARAYGELPSGLRVHRTPRPYQAEALEAWKRARGRGVVVLPTGAGKSHVAMMAMDDKRRDTLIVAPTLDLVRQWFDLLRHSFASPVGVVGGGDHNVQPITVTTYDSAYIHMESLGKRFGMVVFDEVHHLPGESYSMAARMCLAPYRLGLSATPDRPDGRHELMDSLVGPRVYEQDIVGLAGEFLAAYDVERVDVDLSPEELEAYGAARAIYREFIVSQGIRLGGPNGWGEFIMRSSATAAGRRAFKAWHEQRRIAFAAPSKLDYLEHLLHQHRADRTLVFTSNNDAAYAIARRFLVPVITHQTKVTERSQILRGFTEGRWRVVVTSRVLNEGVDVPEANVAVVVSGSGTVREHVQRLGRILRKSGDKRAILYELVAAGTSEAYTSERRRKHVAYGGERADG